MDEQNLYRELLAWLRTQHPLVFAQWERERTRRESPKVGDQPLPKAPLSRSRPGLERLSSDASFSEIVRAMESELESLGISGGTPGFTPEGTPCIHLTKKGIYGAAYEETVTMARLRDMGYRRHLKQVFG